MRYWLNARTPVAVFLVAAFVAACGNAKRGQVVAAPNFELKDLSGNTVRLDAFRGRPVLLDFWATWCGPCRISIPQLQEFYMRHKSDGLVVLGLNIDDEPSVVYSFVKHFKMTYPVLFAGNSAAPGDYEVDGIPLFVFIDPEGRIYQRYQGFSMAMIGAWEDDLRHLLNPTR